MITKYTSKIKIRQTKIPTQKEIEIFHDMAYKYCGLKTDILSNLGNTLPYNDYLMDHKKFKKDAEEIIKLMEEMTEYRKQFYIEDKEEGNKI